MKGYKCRINGKEFDSSPCLFCKYRNRLTVESPCYSCIDNEDLAICKPNSMTDFANFEPRSEAHLTVLKMEQEEKE